MYSNNLLLQEKRGYPKVYQSEQGQEEKGNFFVINASMLLPNLDILERTKVLRTKG